MKTNGKYNSRAVGLSCGGILCAGAILLMAASATAQNLFVSDTALGTVYEYTPGGVESTFTTGTSFPEGLAFDSGGNLFVSSLISGTINEYSPGGAPVPPVPFASGLVQPFGLTFGSSGLLYAADAGSDAIYSYTPSGTPSTFISTAGSGYSPYGLTFDKLGNLFVALHGASDSIVKEYTSGGVFITTFLSGLNSPYDLKFDSAGNLWVADSGKNTIYEYDATGLLLNTINQSTGAWGLAFDAFGNMFATDADGTVYKYTPADLLLPGGGSPSMFVSSGGDLVNGTYLAFNQPSSGVPEQSSTLGLLVIGALAVLGGRRAIAKSQAV
jgi:DNA-binding beta-propeller fold protein YncE